MLTAYSAVTTANLPETAETVFGYCDPPYAQLTEVAKQCPHARIVPVVTHPHYMGEMFDFENGALNPADAGQVIRQQLDRGLRHPICYFALSNHEIVVRSLQAAHIDRGDVRLLPAHYTATPELPDWADGVQWTADANRKSLNAYQLRDDFFRWVAGQQPPVRRRF